ncbi:hypothetical protein F503_00018 [Ophiostoma piceae UAMH 11346]|uniref:Uncharacterized protein n=1 Tax=Ophiostoma piceae (strain UAMH 11346) TaxID=1262450 RepID=S3BUC4_OPHP1|nr:hypothetical protein F503_00018 [Ophiostoma piceae UAMH 11346]
MADSIDRIPLASLTAVGLGKSSKLLVYSPPSAPWSARTAMLAVGIGLVALGTSPDLYAGFAGLFRKVRWHDVVKRIVHVAECSRWFFTVVSITRDVHKRW